MLPFDHGLFLCAELLAKPPPHAIKVGALLVNHPLQGKHNHQYEHSNRTNQASKQQGRHSDRSLSNE